MYPEQSDNGCDCCGCAFIALCLVLSVILIAIF
jgi:hypothetical protein